MRRAPILSVPVFALIVTAALALGNIATASAGQACFETTFTNDGGFTESDCILGGTGNFVKAYNNSSFRRLATLDYCVLVISNETSWYHDQSCITRIKGTSYFSKVHAKPHWFWPYTLEQALIRGGRLTITTAAGKIGCEKLAGQGEVLNTEVSTQLFKVKYSECEAFGSKATISEAEDEYAVEGTEGIVGKNVVVTDSSGCSLTILAGGSDLALEGVEYSNNSEKGTIVAAASILGIHYEASGGACGTAGKKETNGAYTGEAEFEQEGGSVEMQLEP